MRREVTELASRATAADGVAPLSEAFVLGLDGETRAHLLGYGAGGRLAAYGQVAPDWSAELVVDPEQRRGGLGRAVLDGALAEDALRVWAHGDLPAARALAAAAGLDRARDLYLMERPLTPDDAADPVLPEGFTARGFAPGADDRALVETNAAAFADHPEQGRLRLEDLRARMALPWFDPAGLIVVQDVPHGADDPAIAAFHWTKVEPGSTGGEVYVLGVHPAYQGRGLAGPVTRLGIAHLARLGLTRVHLYVDGDNVPARRTYTRLGFVDRAVDVMYAVPDPAPSAAPVDTPSRSAGG